MAQDLLIRQDSNYITIAMSCKPLNPYPLVSKSDILTRLLGLVIYDLVISFHKEAALVWQRRMTATSILLLSTRWALVLSAVATWWIPLTSTEVSNTSFNQ